MLCDGGGCLVQIKALSDLETDPLQLRDDGLVSDVRWIDLEKLRCIGKELRGGHRIDLNLWRRFHIDARINLYFHRFFGVSPFREPRHLVNRLDFANCIIIRRAVRPRSPNDPNEGRWRTDPRHARWDVPAPARWSNKEVGCLCAGRAPTG